MNLEAYCKDKALLTNDQFFDQFPFEEYADSRLGSPLAAMEEDYATLSATGRQAIGNSLIFEATERFLQAHPMDVTQLGKMRADLLLAEQFTQYPGSDTNDLTLLAHSIGDRVMGSVAYRIEEAVAQGEIDKDDPAFATVLDILSRNQYTPNIPTSNTEKFMRHAQEGNWSYIWNRFKTRYLKDTLLALSLLLNAAWLTRLLLRRRTPRTSRLIPTIAPQNNQ